MALVALSLITLLFLSGSHFVFSAGTFYRKVTGNGNDAAVSTKGFHQCSLNKDCRNVGIPVSKSDKRIYLAKSVQELEAIKKKLIIWEKVDKKDPTKKNAPKSQTAFKSCKEAKQAGIQKNGTVKLSLLKNSNSNIEVFCDMETDGGGWLIFQRRINSSVSFQRNWQSYENGFGNLNGNFWLGLNTLHQLTTNGNKWTLRVDLRYSDGDRGYAKYVNFTIGSKQDNYKLMFGAFSGTIGDALANSRGMAFSTSDNDNDIVDNNCAALHKGPWWHKGCFHACLNNWHPGSGRVGMKDTDQMSWYEWKNAYGHIVFSEMKIKVEV